MNQLSLPFYSIDYLMNPHPQGGSVETKETPVSVLFQVGVKLAGFALIINRVKQLIKEMWSRSTIFGYEFMVQIPSC